MQKFLSSEDSERFPFLIHPAMEEGGWRQTGRKDSLLRHIRIMKATLPLFGSNDDFLRL
jgi:hypothetical protein